MCDYFKDSISSIYTDKDKLIEDFAPPDFPFEIDNYESVPKFGIKLRDYQNEAVESWINANRVGLFEMATGTGKTRTAHACINDALLPFVPEDNNTEPIDAAIPVQIVLMSDFT